MDPQNSALWLPGRHSRFTVGPAPYTRPGADEILVRAHALAVNPVDRLPAWAYRLVLPWLGFPAVVGSDVAGEVVEAGADVTRFRPGDRVVGHAFGLEKSRNRAAEGAFQHYVVLMPHMVTALPDALGFERAAVLPLALSTAATGMFQQDHLGLRMPSVRAATPVAPAAPAASGTPTDPVTAAGPAERVGPAGPDETVLVWGGSTSVGSNAIQLARCAGYRVLTTASPHNFDYVRSLGAAAAVDYRSRTAVEDLVGLIGHSPLAGTLAIGSGSLARTVAVAVRTTGTRRVASALPPLSTRLQSLRGRRAGVRISSIWGGTLKDNEVGPGIYADFLPAALAEGVYRAAPEATVVGHGLQAIPEALEQLGRGVSAAKLVVTL